MNDAGARSVLAEVRDQAAAAGVLQPPDVTAPLILSASRWTPAQWWQAFEFLFVGSPDIASQHHQHHDDLLFFVPAAPPTANTSTGGAAPELLVRRRGASLPPDLQLSGALFGAVDWCRSLLLNLVLQARFALTVATCSQDRLVDMQDGANLAAAKTHVQKQVWRGGTGACRSGRCAPHGIARHRANQAGGFVAAPSTSTRILCFFVP